MIQDQKNKISNEISHLDDALKQLGFKRHCVHVGPLIRREAEYSHLSVGERFKILGKILTFAFYVDFLYKTFVVEKRHLQGEAELSFKLAKQIADFIRNNYNFFLSYDKIKIYYDNGQTWVTRIVVTVFSEFLNQIEFRKAFQKDYKLAQVADLVCTATLIDLKMKNKSLSRSELRFFGNERNINKIFLKQIKKKEFERRNKT